MGVSEDAMPQNSQDEQPHGVAKGKRTKRQRTHRTVASSNSLVEASGNTMEEEEEEEDLANCLILLAQGRALDTSTHGDAVKPVEAAASGNPVNYLYKCRTCNKCFSSFQALGGHRTGHKRPKTPAPATMAAMETKKETSHEYDLKISVAAAATYPETRSSSSSAALSGTVTTTAAAKSRSHECSICGLEFLSGQALGGHMRRHRSMVVPALSHEAKKKKNVLDLDLNLPAPPDDEAESSSSATTFPFTGKQTFHLPSLVDCHY